MAPVHLLALQISVAILTCAFAGTLFRILGLHPRAGEATAGILLGLSVFGWTFPTADGFLFPASGGLFQTAAAAAAIVVLFAAVSRYCRTHAPAPFTGSSRAVRRMNAAPSRARFVWSTAPKLRRVVVVTDKALRPNLLVLAVVVAVVTAFIRRQSAHGSLLLLVIQCTAYGPLCLAAVPRLMRRLDRDLAQRIASERHIVECSLIVLAGLAGITSWIGANPLLAAVVLGAAMPAKGALTRACMTSVDHIGEVFGLPLVFVDVGLHTDVTTLPLSTIALLVLLSAAGRLVFAYAARREEESWSCRGCAAWMRSAPERLPTVLVLLLAARHDGLCTPTTFARLALATVLGTMMLPHDQPSRRRRYRPLVSEHSLDGSDG